MVNDEDIDRRVVVAVAEDELAWKGLWAATEPLLLRLIRNSLLGLAMLCMFVGCVATEAPSGDPDPVTPPSQVAMPQVLQHAAGRWIERPPLDAAALAAKCPRCTVAIAHDVGDIYGTYLDAITVYVMRSTVEGIADGSVLCTAVRAYSVSTNQPHGDVGQMVDYEVLADSCGLGSTPIFYEDYALWAARGADVMEVIENPLPADAPAQGFTPVTTWWRCTSESTPSEFCGALVHELASRVTP